VRRRRRKVYSKLTQEEREERQTDIKRDKER